MSEKVYIPKTNEPLTKALLEAALKFHTCGSVVAILAEIESDAGNNECAYALLRSLEVREGVVYVKQEPVKELKYHVALAQDVFTVEVEQVGGKGGVDLYREVHKALHEGEDDKQCG